MLKRIAIFICATAICVTGDTSQASDREFMREWRRTQERHKNLAAQPTPREWRTGAVWRFVTTPPPGKRKPEILTFRVTKEPATSCSLDVEWKNVWYKLVLVKGHKFPGAQPAHQVEGRALAININADICDLNDYIEGVLTEGKFEGKRTTSGLGARPELVGTVRGTYVKP
jgi:hypothetical protein